jgi:hypothetical protein
MLPTDYPRPIGFDTNDKSWRDAAKEHKIQQFCGRGDGGHHHQVERPLWSIADHGGTSAIGKSIRCFYRMSSAIRLPVLSRH